MHLNWCRPRQYSISAKLFCWLCDIVSCHCTGVHEVGEVGMVSRRHQESKGITWRVRQTLSQLCQGLCLSLKVILLIIIMIILMLVFMDCYYGIVFAMIVHLIHYMNADSPPGGHLSWALSPPVGCYRLLLLVSESRLVLHVRCVKLISPSRHCAYGETVFPGIIAC